MSPPSDDRSSSNPLKGPLCAVFMPALTGGGVPDLLKRLGSKATLSDPERGGSSGHAVAEHVQKMAADFGSASFVPERLVVGNDRDIAFGTLELGDSKRRVAVLAVRKKSREIDVRVYYAHDGEGKAEPLAPDMRLVLAKPVGIVLDALAEGDVDEALGLFEEHAVVIDGRGGEHGKATGAMRTVLAGIAQGGFECEPAGCADDGRVCVVEANFQTGKVKRPGLYVFERADSGLFRSLALYP